MSVIANSKFGNCSRCPAISVSCRKRGKDLVCMPCCKKEDNKKQLDNAKEKQLLRTHIPKNDKEYENKVVGTMALQRWFLERREQLTGHCKHCGGKTEKKNPLTYKCSIAHILPKAYFKSVATHPLNWVELCFYGQSCHTNFDNHSLDMLELNCFDEVIEKFIAMYPDIAPDERRRIPAVLLNYVKDNT